MNKCNITIAILCCISLSACSLLSPVKPPQINTYALTAQSGATISSRHQGVVLVAIPSAASGYQTANMMYSLRPYELSSFTKNRWIAPPADMLAPLLQHTMQSSGCFKAVVTPPSTGMADVTVDTQLLELQQQFLTQGSRVRMVMQATLTTTASQQVIATRRFIATVPVMAENPYAGVQAANRATQIVFGEVTRFVCKRR